MAEAGTNNGQNGNGAAQELETLKAEVTKLRGDKDNLNIALHQTREEAKAGREAMQMLKAFDEIIGDIKSNPTVGNLAKLTGLDEQVIIGKVKSEFPKEERTEIDAGTMLPDDSAKVQQLIERAISQKANEFNAQIKSVKGELDLTKKELAAKKQEDANRLFNGTVDSILQTRFGHYSDDLKTTIVKPLVIMALSQLPPNQAAEYVSQKLNEHSSFALTAEAEKSKAKKSGQGGIGHSGGEPKFVEVPTFKTVEEAEAFLDGIPQKYAEQ